jgi:hypothetical protein
MLGSVSGFDPRRFEEGELARRVCREISGASRDLLHDIIDTQRVLQTEGYAFIFPALFFSPLWCAAEPVPSCNGNYSCL